jgi:hypothetical protein
MQSKHFDWWLRGADSDRGAARERAGGSILRSTAGGCSSSPGGSGNSKHSGKKERNPIFYHAEIRRFHTIGKQLEIGRFHNITDIIKTISANLLLEQYEDGGYTN